MASTASGERLGSSRKRAMQITHRRAARPIAASERNNPETAAAPSTTESSKKSRPRRIPELKQKARNSEERTVDDVAMVSLTPTLNELVIRKWFTTFWQSARNLISSSKRRVSGRTRTQRTRPCLAGGGHEGKRRLGSRSRGQANGSAGDRRGTEADGSRPHGRQG